MVGIGVLWLALMAVSWAEAATPSPAPSDDDEYNFSWLDPEKKIYVLQNRRYQKAKKLLLSATVGPGFSNPYRSSLNVDPRLAYYFSESWGFEVFYTLTFNSENSVFKALQGATATLPVVREVRSQLGAQLHWVPWYAKINVFNRILYFDWYFAGGAGSINVARDIRANAQAAEGPYADEQYFAAYLSTGHYYHLSESLVVRMDITGAFYRAPIVVGGEQGWFPNYNFGLGVGLKL